MNYSKTALDLIKKYEGLRLKKYIDAAGYVTIGYGHVIKKTDDIPDTITEKTAENLLQQDIEIAQKKVQKYETIYNFNQNQFDALVSFAFNIGNIDKLTMNGKRSIDAIADAIPKYCNAAGKKLPGLVKRRAEEHALFTTGYDMPVCPFLYCVTIDNLIIRDRPNGDRTGKHTGIGVFTITDINSGFGRLKSGAGWISLDGRYGHVL